MMLRRGFFALLLILISGVALANQNNLHFRTYETSFESVDDFAGFYIVPQDSKPTASHDMATDIVRSGRFSHKGWVTGSNAPSSRFVNNNHRGYPTIQLYKLEGGAFRTPVKIEFWVWLDMDLKPGEWFSFATLDYTTRDTWDPVLVNLSDKGIVHLMHVPTNAKGITTYQNETLKFPFREWVKLSVELHFDKDNGYAKVWQNDILMSEAEVRRGNGLFTQAHFGLYAPPSITSGVIYNDDLVIREMSAN